MKMVKCKKCGKIYPKNLSNCPECFEKNKKYISKGRKAFGTLCIIFGIITIFSVAVNWDDNSLNEHESSSQSQTTSQNNSSEIKQETKGKVNYENFEKIETGMTYEQVVQIFGEEGKVLSESEIDIGIGEEYSTIMYYWYDKTGIANCNIMFQNNKVVSKAQVGLN